MNTEQLLEKMLENVRAEENITEGLQVKNNSEWKQLFTNEVSCCLFGSLEFRFKPRTRNICGFEVPAPEVKEPSMGSKYYVPDPFDESGITLECWNNDSSDISALRNGLWLNYDDAIANAKALRGENPYE